MLDNLFNIKVADFGFLSVERIAKHKTYMGTRVYMAPEMARVAKDRTQEYYDGRKVDVFSMGLTLMNLTLDYRVMDYPSPEEPLYRYIVSKEYNKFWQEVKRKLAYR